MQRDYRLTNAKRLEPKYLWTLIHMMHYRMQRIYVYADRHAISASETRDHMYTYTCCNMHACIASKCLYMYVYKYTRMLCYALLHPD